MIQSNKRATIAIIGAGMGGLAAGIYGQVNGYKTQIFEMHGLPGGQCTSWERKGYTFDGCIHHLFGCNPETKINALWRELGAMPRALATMREKVSVSSPEGKLFSDYYDLQRLEAHLKDLAPQDAKVIDGYLASIRAFCGLDVWGDLMAGGTGDKLRLMPALLPKMRWFSTTMAQYAERFSDPFLRSAFPLMGYSLPDMPFAMHLLYHGYGCMQDVAWPVGGAAAFARSIERRYKELGGQVHYRQKVVEILTENDRAVGLRLDDGTVEGADIVISNADGRKTILEMLGGRYIDERLRGYCAEPDDETNWAVHVFLGVDRDLSQEPSSLVMLLDRPVTIAGHDCKSLEMQMYGHDPTMAPRGKGTIKVELFSGYKYWKALAEDRSRYNEEKQRVADTVIDLLEEHHFPGIRGQVEAVDVPTLLTWERFMGGTHGFACMPKKKPSFVAALAGGGSDMLVPGLASFFLVRTWATSTGALFANALSGKTAIRKICQEDGKSFARLP